MDIGLIFIFGGIFILILCSAFFSSSETALMGASRARLHALEEEGDKRAERVNRMIKKPETLLGTILLGNNLVNIGASALATGAFIKLFGDSGIALATGVMTVLVLIFAEVLPKTLANRAAVPYAMAISWVMMMLIKTLKPFTWAMGKINRFVLRCVGVKSQNSEDFQEEDVRGAIGLGLRHGVLEKNEQQMLSSILDLDDLTVADVMIHRSAMEMLDANAPEEEILDTLATTSYSRLPVWENDSDNIVGILYVKDFMRAYLRHNHKHAKEPINIKPILREAYFVPETAPIDDQLKEFKITRRHIAVVVDEYGDIQGLVTLEDIIEEIVGEIQDEHDVEDTAFKVEANGDVFVAGHYPIRDANKEFDWNLPDEDAVTIAGLIIETAERIPASGETITVGDYQFTVMSKKRQAILQVRVRPQN